MTKITVHTNPPYPVFIKEGGFSKIKEILPLSPKSTRYFLISDDVVYPQYGTQLKQQLQQEGYRVIPFVFPQGEQQKNRDTLFRLLDFLSAHQGGKSDLLLALGGGVVGDLTGFASAIYLRGVSWINLPTTLLAMVDSSVGGKTGINTPWGKNIIGAFHQPSLVLCDVALLSTLPLPLLQEGVAEIVKCGLLSNAKLLTQLVEHPLEDSYEYLISGCLTIKKNLVQADETDKNQRNFLNLGHTFGHAIESCSGYTISHGQGVSMGLVIATKLGESFFQQPDNSLSTYISQILQQYHLPIQCPFSPKELAKAILWDKKRQEHHIVCILPKTLEQCQQVSLPLGQLEHFISLGI